MRRIARSVAVLVGACAAPTAPLEIPAPAAIAVVSVAHTIPIRGSECWRYPPSSPTPDRGYWPHVVPRSLPALGTGFLVDLHTHGLPDSRAPRPAWLLIGTRPGFVDLAGSGMPGCALHFQLAGAWFLPADQDVDLGWLRRASGDRTAHLDYPIPADVGLAGSHWWLQMATNDAGANPAGVLLSGALEVVVGIGYRELDQ